MNSFLFPLALAVIPAVLAITLHEAAHGYAALALGDQTARREGRLSLNPLRHVDRFGTIVLPGFLLISQLLTIGRVEFMFGWAKPVPVNPWAFANPRRGMMWVAMAGPAMNFFLAWVAALFLPTLPIHGRADVLTYLDAVERYSPVVGGFLVSFMVFNAVLGLFNLLPLPPLDGGRIVVGLLPLPLAAAWARLERVGIVIVLFLVFILPMLARELGFVFEPVRGFLGAALPWLMWLILHLAGFQAGIGSHVLII